VCLHGYLQNAALFRTRTGSLRKGLKSRAGAFAYVDAPYEASEARTVVWVAAEGDEGGAEGGGGGEERLAGGGADDAAAATAAAAAAADAAAAAPSGSATDGEAGAAAPGGAGGGRSWFCWEEVRRRAPPGGAAAASAAAADGAPPSPRPTRPSQATRYTGWEASFQAIAAALKAAAAGEEGAAAVGAPPAAAQPASAAAARAPRLGLVGFSQGAAAGALFLSDLAERQARGECRDVPFPAFAVLCAGFLPRDAACAGLIRRQRAGGVPVLVVTGESDALVPRERSDALVAALRGEEGEGGGGGGSRQAAAREWLHPGGHLLPTCSGAFKGALVAFLDEAEAQTAVAAAR